MWEGTGKVPEVVWEILNCYSKSTITKRVNVCILYLWPFFNDILTLLLLYFCCRPHALFNNIFYFTVYYLVLWICRVPLRRLCVVDPGTTTSFLLFYSCSCSCFFASVFFYIPSTVSFFISCVLRVFVPFCSSYTVMFTTSFSFFIFYFYCAVHCAYIYT